MPLTKVLIVSARFHNAILTPNEPSVLDGVEFYCFTYVVGHLVVRTHAARWKDDRRAGVTVPKTDPYWDPAAVQFWPHSEPISWPPSKYIGDHTLEALMNRFNLPINVLTLLPRWENIGNMATDWTFT